MKVIEPGHIYELENLESPGAQRLTFIKRSSKMIDYGETEHPGTNTQELFRAIIELAKVGLDRSEYLNSVQSCQETEDAIAFCREVVSNARLALYSYEVRALRRKRAKLNKEAGKHVDEGDMSAHRDGFNDIPFSAEDIENLPVGPDGHIVYN